MSVLKNDSGRIKTKYLANSTNFILNKAGVFKTY